MNAKIHIFSIALILLILIIGFVISSPSGLITFYVSTFGFISLIGIIFVLFIPLFLKIKQNNFTSVLMGNRRWIGIYVFIFALIHLVIVYNFFFNWDIVNAISNPYRAIGSIAFLVLLIMAITSNNTAMKKLGKNWKRIQYFIYAVLIITIFHAFNIGVIFFQNDIIKIIIPVLFVIILIGKLYIKARK
ncbi:ferric reductase-like transmembrane domain-containing protein [Candidatus Aenigmatarchaeota archaeon]